jgi:polyisoprenoid-binding protein YceI
VDLGRCLLTATTGFCLACTSAGRDGAVPPSVVSTAAPVAATPEPAPHASARTVRSYRVAPERSHVRVIASSPLGEHPMTLRRVEGRARVFDADLTRSTFEIEIDARSVEAGSDFLTSLVRSPRVLDVARFPKARFVSLEIRRDPAGQGVYRLAGALTLHGVTRPVDVSARVRRRDGEFVAQTTFWLRRQDFAIRPGGLLSLLVHDEVRVELELVAVAAPTH